MVFRLVPTSGQFDPKFDVEGVVSHQPFSCQKTRMNDLSCGIRMWAQVTFTKHKVCVRQTDKQRGLDNTVRRITCSRTVKTKLIKN